MKWPFRKKKIEEPSPIGYPPEYQVYHLLNSPRALHLPLTIERFFAIQKGESTVENIDIEYRSEIVKNRVIFVIFHQGYGPEVIIFHVSKFVLGSNRIEVHLGSKIEIIHYWPYPL